MTPQEVIDQAYADAKPKAEELSTLLGVKVYPLCFVDGENEDKPIVGFIKEPPRQVKIAVLDKNLVAPFSAASEMYDLILLKEHSDPRMWPEGTDDSVYLGAVNAAWERVKMKIDQFAKKK